MRQFQSIYRELRKATNFHEKPTTESESIQSLNIFFEEIKDELGYSYPADDHMYWFLVQSYRWNAKQWVTDVRTNISYRQFLSRVYSNLKERV